MSNSRESKKTSPKSPAAPAPAAPGLLVSPHELGAGDDDPIESLIADVADTLSVLGEVRGLPDAVPSVLSTCRIRLELARRLHLEAVSRRKAVSR